VTHLPRRTAIPVEGERLRVVEFKPRLPAQASAAAAPALHPGGPDLPGLWGFTPGRAGGTRGGTAPGHGSPRARGSATLLHPGRLRCAGRGFPRSVPRGRGSAAEPGSARPAVGAVLVMGSCAGSGELCRRWELCRQWELCQRWELCQWWELCRRWELCRQWELCRRWELWRQWELCRRWELCWSWGPVPALGAVPVMGSCAGGGNCAGGGSCASHGELCWRWELCWCRASRALRVAPWDELSQRRLTPLN